MGRQAHTLVIILAFILSLLAQASLASAVLDVDDSGRTDPSTDGILILRYLFGFHVPVLTDGVVSADGQRDAADIESYLDSVRADLDVDGDGRSDALSDGLLILRYLAGYTDGVLVDGVVSPGATHATPDEIVAILRQMEQGPFPPFVIYLAPGQAELEFSAFGEQRKLIVFGKSTGGAFVDLSAGKTGTTYTTSYPGIVSVSQDGVLTALDRGSSTIRIRNGAEVAELAVRVSPPPLSLPTEVQQAASELEAQLGPDLSIRFDERTGVPRLLLDRSGYLSKPSVLPPVDILRNFLLKWHDLFALTAEALEEFEPSQYVSRHTGVTHLTLTQYVSQIPVFSAHLRANINRDGRLINIGGNYYPGARLDLDPTLSPNEALSAAIRSVDPGADTTLSKLQGPDGATQETVFEAGPYAGEHRVSLTVYPFGATFTLCWQVQFLQAADKVLLILVDAQSGDIVWVANMAVE